MDGDDIDVRRAEELQELRDPRHALRCVIRGGQDPTRSPMVRAGPFGWDQDERFRDRLGDGERDVPAWSWAAGRTTRPHDAEEHVLGSELQR